MILNPYKTMALVVSPSRTVNSPHGDLAKLDVFISAFPNLDILVIKFDSMLTCDDHVRAGIVSLVSQRIGILRLAKRIFVDTSVLLRCYYAFVLSFFKHCSLVWGSAADCHIQLLELQVCSVARICPVQNFLSLCFNVVLLDYVCCTRLIRTRIIVCSVSFQLLLPEFNIPELLSQLMH